MIDLTLIEDDPQFCVGGLLVGGFGAKYKARCTRQRMVCKEKDGAQGREVDKESTWS